MLFLKAGARSRSIVHETTSALVAIRLTLSRRRRLGTSCALAAGASGWRLNEEVISWALPPAKAPPCSGAPLNALVVVQRRAEALYADRIQALIQETLGRETVAAADLYDGTYGVLGNQVIPHLRRKRVTVLTATTRYQWPQRYGMV